LSLHGDSARFVRNHIHAATYASRFVQVSYIKVSLNHSSLSQALTTSIAAFGLPSIIQRLSDGQWNGITFLLHMTLRAQSALLSLRKYNKVASTPGALALTSDIRAWTGAPGVLATLLYISSYFVQGVISDGIVDCSTN